MTIDAPDARTPGSPAGDGPVPHVRLAIVGSGFSGLAVARQAMADGIDDLAIFERDDEPGGTWRDNRYPGCQCDVPSHLYSYSFAPNPDWTRAFAPAEEIYDYTLRCIEDFDVADKIHLGHEVLDARWDDDGQLWRIETTGGACTANLLVGGQGPLSEPVIPEVAGIDRFAGPQMHSAHWDHDLDLTGKRVAVVGTGASAIQIVPSIQPIVDELVVFQRTPAWIVPRLDHDIPSATRSLFRRLPIAQRAVRTWIYWTRELLVLGMTGKVPKLLDLVGEGSRTFLEATVHDPGLRAKLTPDYSPGCKRLLLSNDFYPAVAAPNCTLVTAGVAEVTETGIVDAAGTEHEVDAIVWATGFRATDHPLNDRVHGRDGRSLAQVWRDEGMSAHLGTTVHGFPNLFLMVGPNTGLGHNSIIFMIECQVRYLSEAWNAMRAHGAATLEVTRPAQAAFAQEMQDRLDGTVWLSGCASWYLDDEGRNTTLWPGFTWQYWLRTRRFDADAHVLQPRHRTPVTT